MPSRPNRFLGLRGAETPLGGGALPPELNSGLRRRSTGRHSHIPSLTYLPLAGSRGRGWPDPKQQPARRDFYPRRLVASTWCGPPGSHCHLSHPIPPPLCRLRPGHASAGYIGLSGRWRPVVGASGQRGDASLEAGDGKAAAGASASGTGLRGRSGLKTPDLLQGSRIFEPRGRLPGTCEVQ